MTGLGRATFGIKASPLVRTTRKFEVSGALRAQLIAQHGPLLPRALFDKLFGVQGASALRPSTPLVTAPGFRPPALWHECPNSPSRFEPDGPGPAIWFCRDADGVPLWPLRWQAKGLDVLLSKNQDRPGDSGLVAVGFHIEGPGHKFDQVGQYYNLVMPDAGIRTHGRCDVDFAFRHSYTVWVFVTYAENKLPLIFSEQIHFRLELSARPIFLQIKPA